MSTNSPALLQTMRRIDALLQSGNFRAAHNELETLLNDNPKFVDATRLLAGTKQALGDIDGAEKLFRHAIKLDPSWTPTLTSLGELLLNKGSSAEAEALLQRAVTGSPRYPRAGVVLARYYNDAQRPADAIAVISGFLNDGQVDTELAAQHVAALAALGRQPEAVQHYQQVLDASPTDSSAAQALAMALDSASRHADAANLIRNISATGYKNAALYNTHARSLIALGEFDRAEVALRDCLRLDPRILEAHSNLARLIWMRSGDVREATALLDQALQTFGNDDALRATKAAVLQGAGDARGAYACLLATAMRSQAPPALLVRAGLAALEFDSDAALALATRALQATPNNATARSLLIAALLGVGEAQAALPHCQRLLAHAPDDQYLIALQTTAWRLLGDERYAQACDYKNLVMPSQLETPDGWPDRAEFFTALKSGLQRLHNPQGHALLFQSLRNGTETTEDLTRSGDPAIRALFKMFDAPIHRYLAHIGRGSDPLRQRNNGSYRFNGSWSVRLRDSGFHSNHVHPRGWISSACYIDLPASVLHPQNQAGALTFGEPSIPTMPHLPAQHTVRPEVGLLVLFPSYFWHGTVPFSSDQSRLTVAFDLVPPN